MLSQSRTVLLIADEALYVYAVASRKTKLVEVVPWATQYFEDVVIDLIKKDCNGRPVLVLNDMTDLHFKGGQRIPKVGPLDKKNVLNRKLQVSFPNYPIRGAIPIKQPKGSVDDVPGDLYLFAAVPMVDPIVKTMDAVRRSLVSIAGFYILPIEATDMVATLAKKLAAKESRSSRWAIFLGQHQDGSLRQVITRDGQLAMTRMTPVSDSDLNPQQWATEVAQEFRATLGYLSRFGYSQDQPTDIMVIANQEAAETLEGLLNVGPQLTVLNILEAAKLLGISLGDQVDTRYADILHASWIGRKSKFVLPMKAKDIESVVGPRRFVTFASLALFAGSLFFAYQVLMQTSSMVGYQSDIKDQKELFVRANAEYETEAKRLEALGLDIKLIRGALDAHSNFIDKEIDFLGLVQQIGVGLGNDLRLDDLTIKKVENDSNSRGRGVPIPGGEKSQIEALLSFSFPPSIQLEEGIRQTNNLENRLKNLLPEYDVSIVRQVARPEYTQRVSGVADDGEAETSEEDYTAEIEIKGPST